jgi:phosphoenolpyruvate synthase/pyruvate phosphate dikinase
MDDYVISLDDPAAADAACVGPKAANLAVLAQAGLPTPGGFCLTADAYRRQIAYLKLADSVRDYRDADTAAQRRLSVAIRLQLYQGDLAPDLKEQILDVWEAVRPKHQGRISNRFARVLGRVVDDQRAARNDPTRPLSRRHRDGGAQSAAGRRDRVRQRVKRDRRRQHASQRHVCHARVVA